MDSLRVTLRAPSEIPRGRPIPFILRVENTGGTPLDLYLRGRELTFDVVVRGEDGTEVWRRLQGRIIPAVVQLMTLAAGASIVRRTTWNQRTSGVPPAGIYRARASLLTEASTIDSAEVSLRIT